VDDAGVDVSLTAWVALAAGLVALLLLDLFVIHRDATVVSIRDAAWSSAGFVAVSVAFGIGLGVVEGLDIAQQFFAGYVLEKSLSLDNVFVWAVIFSSFGIPEAYQRRVLFYGVFSALVLRAGFVAAGNELLTRFEWVVYVFGALLLWSGLRLLRHGSGHDPAVSAVLRFFERHFPTTTRLAGPRLLVRASEVPEADRPRRRPLFGRWYATPLLVVLVVIEATDVIFAVDSIPAIFGVTREPFIVFSATALALLGLRSLYFLLAGVRMRFAYLDTGLAIILAFVGAKFLLADVVEIGPTVSLVVIVGVVATAIGASALRSAPR
jgi:tellurite resistance protein TerC